MYAPSSFVYVEPHIGTLGNPYGDLQGCGVIDAGPDFPIVILFYRFGV